jgi:hypothetical protein
MPGDIVTCMYRTGVDPMGMRDRKIQRALM